MCGEHFNSAEIWCEIHVEGGECKFYPWDLKVNQESRID